MKHWRNVALALALLLGSVVPAFAQFDRGTISGTIKDEQGGVMPGVTVTATNTQTQQAATTTTDGTRLLHVPEPAARPVRHPRRAAGLQEGHAGRTCSSTPPAPSRIDFALQTGTISRGSDGHRRASPPLQTDVAMRKTVEAKDIEQLSFSGRNPIGVVGLKAGVMGGNFNSRGFSDLGNGGFNINGSRTDENNITIDGATAIRTRAARRHRRHPERRRDPGSPGPDRQLHARVRARQRRPDPLRDQERQQPLQRQRLVLLPRRQAAGQHLGAQPEPERAREQRAGAVRLQAVRLLVRRPDAGLDVQGPAVLLRRPGMGELLRGPDQQRHRADRGDAARRLQRAAEPGESVLRPRRHDHRPADRPAVPEQRHSGQPAVAERAGAPRTRIRCRRRATSRARTTRSSPARTRRISGRTTSASTTG